MIHITSESSRYNPDRKEITVTLPDIDAPDHFFALDVETACHSRGICQIGIAEFTGGFVTDKLNLLIQPPENYFDYFSSKVHGILPSMTKDSPVFPIVWPKIKQMIKGQTLVIHNSAFDLAAIDKDLELYDLGDLSLFSVIDTCQELGRCDLYSACKFFSVDLSKHHDALSDAIACGELLIAYSKRKGETVTIPKLKERPITAMHNRVYHDPIKKCQPVLDSDTFFTGKKVVITGLFESWPERNELAILLSEMGATITSAVSGKTDFLIIGSDPGTTKMSKAKSIIQNGGGIRLITEDELKKLL